MTIAAAIAACRPIALVSLALIALTAWRLLSRVLLTSESRILISLLTLILIPLLLGHGSLLCGLARRSAKAGVVARQREYSLRRSGTNELQQCGSGAS
jgi:hypothetical protein